MNAKENRSQHDQVISGLQALNETKIHNLEKGC